MRNWIEKTGNWCMSFVDEMGIPAASDYVSSSIQELFDEIKRNLEVNRPWKGELKGKVKDDGEIWVHATITPFFNKKGEEKNEK